ncbi:hypothetical protein SAMN05216223_11414 [Actinacidiphila yanglinensis]|uniref:Competence protein CoiA-like family protein n=1 Tax=Actinacidiphila yanglinensis TaxID=310779 RepID=A0A1H6DD16_9ACTN|nr:hypothetical protein [Actinacidiphila yanglinensis]SEG83178.1 hypothetical protein SAMN05216223_11414 [Actinacidiphila yanglinensis]
MSEYAYDHRLVQTAVIGHKESDVPVILPMDATDLDVWRKLHPAYTYWCGLQLGGCGGALSDKRYTHKVCHFAHHPTAPICHRTANGESSADHLFIKQGVRRLLDGHQVRGTVQTRNLGNGPGDAVDVQIPASRRTLRFQLAPLDYPAWRRATDELSAEADRIDWILAADGPITQHLLGRHGYCMRVRCETVGGDRRVHIGAEAPDQTVSWTPLEDCVLTTSGIVTPHVEQIRLSRHRPKPFAFPVQGGLVFALVPGSEPPAGSAFAAEDRHLLVADVKAGDSPIVRALISLPRDAKPLPAGHVYRVPDRARILVTDNGQGWAVEATRFVRLDAHEAQRTGLWTPPARPEPGPTVPAHKPVVRNAPAVRAAEVADSTPTTSPRQLSHGELVNAVREALITHARLRSTTTWGTLTRTIGAELRGLPREDRERLLVAVDAPLRENLPVLSALVRYDGEPLPYLVDVLIELGVPYARLSSPIKRWAAVEIERAFAAYGVPPRTMPPRHSLRPEQPTGYGYDAELAELLAGHAIRAERAAAKERGQTKRRAARNDPGVKRVRSAYLEIERLWPRLGKKARREINQSFMEARHWLSFHDGATLTKRRRHEAASQSAEQHERALARALAVAREDALAVAPRQRERPVSTAPKAASSNLNPSLRSAPSPVPAVRTTPAERLTRQLMDVAARGATVALLDLEGGRSLPDHAMRGRLVAVDSKTTRELPLLSALVTDADSRPVPFFRGILQDLGFAVPRTDEALLRIWRREQERAHAAHGNPPRPLLPRLVPPAEAAERD